VFWSRYSERGQAGTVDVAFTDRHGGVSSAPFDSLDLGGSGPDGAANREANFATLAKAFGVDGFATMRQVHGREVCTVGAPTDPRPTCDGLVTDVPMVALCVRVADCVPVVLADADVGITGVAHAGRNGVVAGVVGATVEAMRTLGARDILGWIGPHVCGGCYEVPDQLRAAVSEVVPAAFACTTWGTPSLDLGAAVRAELVACGVVASAVPGCTRESIDLYSYRRDRAGSGRFAGLVVLREPDRG
jgi:YfiH family protein